MPGIVVRLSVMMFLQFSVWGAWFTALYPYLTENLGFTGPQASGIFGTLWLACMIAPMIGGQIVDRFFPTQIFLAFAHLAGAVLLYLASVQTNYGPMWYCALLYGLLYAPTLALVVSISMHHLADPDKQFGPVRTWGTVGWILAGWSVTVIRTLFHTQTWTDRSDLFTIASVLSLITGLYCFALPHTPPKREAANPFAFLEAIALLKDRNFLVFMLCSFVVTTELQFYYIPTAAFLQDGGVSAEWVTTVLTTAQIAEIVVLAFLLRISLKRYGVRRTMAIGILAWPLRYFLFTVPSLPVIIASLTLHGFGYAFFFVASQIYVDRKASSDTRASAQALLTFFTLGLGNFLGTMFTGWCLEWFKNVETGATNWTPFFLVPAGICIAVAIIFLTLFRDDAHGAAEQA
ncbi:MAG: MFS transporter [Candidatus Hydrogenedentes bacterium]|nr:MFS transporter [Candidatus Hydrogenedentota bacterium]